MLSLGAPFCSQFGLHPVPLLVYRFLNGLLVPLESLVQLFNPHSVLVLLFPVNKRYAVR